MRRTLVVGNWKMHGSLASVETLLGELRAADLSAETEVAVCPTYIHLPVALRAADGLSIALGAQDCSHTQAGAYTGEVSPAMLADLGCHWVILGHSERRQYHDESDELVSGKMSAAIEVGLRPILCVGETREQREAGSAEEVVAAQLRGALSGQQITGELVVAYEPVWAIGTGLTATPEQAQQMHAFIRQCLRDMAGVVADDIRLLYGGSVKPGNAALLFGEPDIDGALVGGAALIAGDFAAIVNAGVA